MNRGCWLSDPLNYKFGRRGTIFFAAVFCLGTVVGSACSQTWQQLLVCRLLLGLGMGAKATTIPIFAAESSPSQIRGGLVMSWQMWVAFGIFLYESFLGAYPESY
jgi:MFS family permease